ncbi:amino acid adenylation domain-containing protein [Micromonospora sp. LOL_021]|uniref:amino acid adenylation domain-containing protein n=1 Tax=Micromonospora sp. LOL_021 TaxID=3345417 RepID=UPI003A867257
MTTMADHPCTDEPERQVGQGVHDLVAKWVRQTPNAPAVRHPITGQSLSYAELWHQAGLMVDDLANRRVGQGSVVAVRLPRSVDLIVALLGIVRAGAAYLCLDDAAPPDRLAVMLDQAAAALVVHPPGQDSRAATRGLRLVPHATRTQPATRGPVSGDDAIYVMFTSGSTGTPKGVIVPHRAVRRLAVEPLFCTIEPGDRVANGSNPAFDAATFEIWNTLVAGGTIVVFPALTGVTFSRWATLLADESISTMFLTTSLFHLIARERPEVFRTLRTLVVGGEQLELAAVRRVLAAGPPTRLVNGYGPTETTTFAAYFDCTEESLAGLDRVPIGIPLQNTSLQILDGELKPVPAGETGELCVGGPGVAIGYLNRPELTAERFVREPSSGCRIYRTGDLARLLPSGAIELLGRMDRQVKLWGFRIELTEIESAVMATGQVDAAFVETTGSGADAMLVGFVLPTQPVEEPSEFRRSLNNALRRRLPGYMIPARWIFLSQVPLGATGKVDRSRLVTLLSEAP